MWLMSGSEYRSLTEQAKELERDRFGVKVLLLPDERIVKLFRLKRWFSLSAIYPYSFRFRRNARRVRKLGLSSVQVERVFYCPAIRRHGVIYPRLAGKTLADLLTREPERTELLEELALYMAQLHLTGVYFRSLHLGNVLLQSQGGLALIDVADMRFRNRPLNGSERARNFGHLLRKPEQRAIIERFGMDTFLELYRRSAGYSGQQMGPIKQACAALH